MSPAVAPPAARRRRRSDNHETRTWSLRREWSRAFVVLVALFVLSSAGSLLGVRHIVGQFGRTSHHLETQMTVLVELRTAVLDHAELGHRLLGGQAVDRTTFVDQQNEITAAFATGRTELGVTHGAALLARAAQTWRSSLTTAGLWSTQLSALHGPDEGPQFPFEGQTDAVLDQLDGLQTPALAAVNAALSHDDEVERSLMVVLFSLFGLSIAALTYFRRRMSRYLLRPVADLHHGVVELQSGGFSHRIQLTRRDELGELADAFNAMAGALDQSHRDLTERATKDSLTGLANRASLTERLNASFATSPQGGGQPVSVLFIDIDDFKDVNDRFGHEAGDELLVELAARLLESVRPQDLVARLGGDEFAVVVVEGDDSSTVIDIADRLLAALRRPFCVQGTPLPVAASIGIAQRRSDAADAVELLRQADFAMYMAKGSGKDGYQVFDAQMHAGVVQRHALKTDLSTAVSQDQLRLHYQPVVDLVSGETVGVEALVRWQHPALGLLAPDKFIPLAEQTGDIDAIGAWVLDTAAREVAGWGPRPPGQPDLWVSVNVSVLSVATTHGVQVLEAILDHPAVNARNVVLEITESAMAADPETTVSALTRLKDLGVRIAIDDFGTGFSSLSVLSDHPTDILKIDRSFVSGQTSQQPSISMLDGILGLAEKLSLEVIAEGIERQDQLDVLRSLGCRLGQGYLLARPMPAAELQALLAAGPLLHPPLPVA